MGQRRDLDAGADRGELKGLPDLVDHGADQQEGSDLSPRNVPVVEYQHWRLQPHDRSDDLQAEPFEMNDRRPQFGQRRRRRAADPIGEPASRYPNENRSRDPAPLTTR